MNEPIIWGDAGKYEDHKISTIVKKFHVDITEEWQLARDRYPGEDDFVGLLDLVGGRLSLGRRIDLIKAFEENEKAPNLVKYITQPAGRASPTMPNYSCMWLLIRDIDGKSFLVRFISERLGLGGSA